MNWYNETQLHTPTEVSKPTEETPIVHLPEFVSNEAHAQWVQYVNSSLMELQSKIEEVSVFRGRRGEVKSRLPVKS